MDFFDWFSSLHFLLQWFLAITTFILAVLSFLQSKGWPIVNMITAFTRRFIWEGRDHWHGYPRPPLNKKIQHDPFRTGEHAFKGGNDEWCSMQAQYEGEQFGLALNKPRTIKRIRFLNNHLENTPKRIKLTCKSSINDTAPFVQEYDTSQGIDITFDCPKKIFRIDVDIVVPNYDGRSGGEANAWRITDIQLTEVRFYGERMIPE